MCIVARALGEGEPDSGGIYGARIVVSVPLIRQRQKVHMILQSDTARHM